MSQEEEIVAALFAAAMGGAGSGPGSGSWDGFLALLAQITRAETALMQLSWSGSRRHVWQSGVPWGGLGEDVVERMRSGRVYSQIDLPGADAGAGSAAQPRRALLLRIEGAGRVLIALRRSGSDFHAIDGRQLSNLTPYFGPALNGWRQLCRDRAQAALDRQICGDLGAGWILFSASGQVLEVADGLVARLQTVAGIGLSADGWLSLPAPAAQALRRALVALARPGAAAQWIVLSPDPLVQLLLEPRHPTGDPLLVGRLRHGLSARAQAPERLSAAFGISRSEARLAARLCDGLSLSEAAAELGWTVETARSASKQLFARMGVRGQTGVVRQVLASAVWLEGCAADDGRGLHRDAGRGTGRIRNAATGDRNC
ncbi:hypothetical protein [Pseudoruegeria sp. SK021]|uniref:helix-turn-helix transcriptional regulator n=1 Tax=Pseudoruegeria sp. SK021 TaxID=1933035 RepID=UPI000A21E6FB|nr:hypothetical protein [Pseudoruegeria sp. SK021]OSP54086.1 hypothetical protein BV911_14455 [Pseudoruegeria sp. SK021]